MSGEQFSLVWNTFPSNLSSGLYNLLTGEQLVDVTLAAEGQILRAHKLILSVCSSYFRELFKGNSCKHPIVILKDVNYRDLSAMLHFMYQGEVNIKQEDIASFLKVAEVLQIKGLTKNNDEENVGKDGEASDLSLQNELYSLQQETFHSEFHKQQLEQTSNQCQCQTGIKNEEPSECISASEPSCIYENISENSSAAYNKEQYFHGDCQTMTEPLNFTSKNNNTDESENNSGMLDYKSSMDIDNQNKTTITDGNAEQTAISQQQDTSHFPTIQYDEPYSQDIIHEAPPLDGEFTHDSNGCTKGKKTVKGMPSSSLSLETTLRVISELGPTLRIERGKVMRMYSCPWCLRHFTRKENLKLHVRYIHGPLESLTCKLCGNKYKNSNSLRVHSYLYHNARRNKYTKKPIVSDVV